MISSLRGPVLELAASYAVIDIAGLGIQAYATPTTLTHLQVGQSVHLVTRLISREDSLTLYAFAHAQEREVFDALITINGVGPKLALAVLSVLAPRTVREAAANADGKTFTTVPGIGPKVANRIVLELAGKLPPEESAAGNADNTVLSRDREVVEALVGLGWNHREAKARVAAAFEAQPDIAQLTDTGQILRAVLTWLGRDSTRRPVELGS